MKHFLKATVCSVFGVMGIAVAEQESPYAVIPEPAAVSSTSATTAVRKLLSQQKDSSLGAEGYKLSIQPQGVALSYGDGAGQFYALQTLSQIDLQYKGQPLPCGVITDKPRFPWRGLMLDPARHFIPVADVKKFIDVMAFYKFNKLHIHLTDDQGWRFAVPGYPKLNSISSKRAQTFGNNTPHEGMYTREQLKDIVAYAGKKFVEVIPEVDAPGHNQALAAAYPELICYPRPDIKVKEDGGVTLDLVCPGKPEVWKFYAAVFDELKEIFPSKYVHLGGDEAPEDHWKTCPNCAKWRAQFKIKSPSPLPDNATEAQKKKYNDEMLVAVREEMKTFFSQMGKMLSRRGKEVLFWYEEPIADYPKGSTVYTWRMGKTPDTIKQSRERGLKLICSPGEHAYLDYPQFPNDVPKLEPGGGWMPITTLKRTYALDPGYGLPEEDQKHIIGVEATMWAECIPDINRAFYMAYPRALALVEAGWSPMKVRSWDNFLKKLEVHKKIMQSQWGISLERPGVE